MAAHITYLSEAGLTEKFGRRLQAREAKTFGFDADFQVESYLRHQGLSFTDRFDANSYLYITRAMDYFDLAEEHGGLLANAFKGTKTRFALVSFDTDWLYPTAESRIIVHALNAAGAAVSFVELNSPYGHDAFLLDSPELNRVVDGFLRAAHDRALDDDKARLQIVARVHRLARRRAIGRRGSTRDTVERAIVGSHCLGAYDAMASRSDLRGRSPIMRPSPGSPMCGSRRSVRGQGTRAPDGRLVPRPSRFAGDAAHRAGHGGRARRVRASVSTCCARTLHGAASSDFAQC